MEFLTMVANATICSAAFWYVFLGCLWFTGIVAYAVQGGYRCSFEDMLFIEVKGFWRDVVVVVDTLLWPIVTAVGSILFVVVIALIFLEEYRHGN